MLIGIDGNEANVNQRVGSNIYAFELIKALEALDQRNEYIIYLSEKRVADLPKEKNKFFYRVIPPKKLWTQWRLPLDLYFHQPRPQVFFTPGHYAPRCCPMPSVITILDLSFLLFPQTFKPLVRQQLRRWTYRSAKKAAHILTISQASKKDIIKHYQIKPDKITVTYPGIHPRFQRKVSVTKIKKIKQKYQIPGQYVLYVGTLQPRKNLPRLIKAFTQISTSYPDLYLVLAGKIWLQFAAIDSHLLKASRVIQAGYVPDVDLPALYAGAKAFVYPSLYEGFGLPAAEALASGTLVIAANTSSLPEVVGQAGILIKPQAVDSIAQAIKQILSLPKQKRVQLIKEGKKQVQKFTWSASAQKTLEVLNEIAV